MRWSALFAFPLIALCWQIAAPNAQATDLRYFEDAPLRSVQFVDAKEGFAVGDEGVLWHTIDGGKTWERKATGVRASLRSVCFLRPYVGVGWIAGREELPGGGSVGVLLFTRDGGVKWHRMLSNSLPGLNLVRFIDNKTGFLLGDCNESFPSGVFKTVDSGRTWEPVPGPRYSSWHAGDFQDANTCILAGAWSRVATFRNNRFESAQVEAIDGRSILGLQVLPQRILAVGQGGLMLSSISGGVRWGFHNTGLPRTVLSSLDFHAIAAVGPRVWVAGRPGSNILHSTDEGQSWRLQPTGQPFPLHDISFYDEKRGWAVGEAGTILGTVDGGKTWSLQRQGARRSAALFVHARPENVPVDTLAQLGAGDGYLAANLRILASDASSAPLTDASQPQRFAFAARRAGGLTGESLWQFPLPQHLAHADKTRILEHWNRLHGNQAERELLRQLVLSLRMWRPNVVITDSPDASDTVTSLLGEALKVAIRQAADAQSFPEQITQLGLTPWNVARVYAVTDMQGNVVFDNNLSIARLKSTANEYAEPARRVLGDMLPPLPEQRSYALLHSAAANTDRLRHFFDGLSVAEGEARRKQDPDPTLPAAVAKAIQTQRHLINITQRMKEPAQTLAQIGPLLATLPDDIAATTAYTIANNFARVGQWHLAREAFLLMVDRYPAHPLSAEAYRWLIRHASSSEARRRHERGQFLLSTTKTFSTVLPQKDNGVQPTSGTKPSIDGNLTMLRNQEETRHWYRGSLKIGNRLLGFGPLYAFDPSIQFCLQSSRRQLGEHDASLKWFQQFAQYSAQGPWKSAAQAEIWLTQPGGPAPKAVATCWNSDQRPFLDGKLNDACWRDKKPLKLQNSVGSTAEDYTTEAWFAYDREFLYVALRCTHPKGHHVPRVKNRKRDDDLTPFDRVSILLDLDRDYGTYYQLTVDQRGCARDDCWGDAGWNPRWFIAADSTETQWCIEAAIPINELTGDQVVPNSAWAGNVVRTLPGRGVQGWSLPADVEPRPEGMGLLLFRNQ